MKIIIATVEHCYIYVNIDDTIAKVGVIGSFCNCIKKLDNIANIVKSNDLHKDFLGDKSFYVTCLGCQVSTDAMKIKNIYEDKVTNILFDDDYFYTNYEIADIVSKNEIKIVDDNLNADIYVGDINEKKIYANKNLVEKIEYNIKCNDIEFLQKMMLKNKSTKEIKYN